MTITPLHDVHIALGATLTSFAGWSMPLRYTSDVAEHHAVRQSAGIFDLCHMGEIEVSGPGAGAALDWAVVGRPSAIGVGRARYSMVCAADGGILDDLVVYRLAEQRYLIVANASNALGVVDALIERTSGFDATVADVSLQWALIAVQGPASPAIMADAGVDVTALKYYTIDPAVISGAPVLLARTGYTGEDGFEVYCAADRALEVWAALTQAGQPHGLTPAGLACRDSLRLEAGMPLYGHELTARTSPYDVGLGRVVVLDKPDGTYALDALRARREHPQFGLVGLVGPGRRAPRAGYDVLTPSGQRVGTITSGVPSPTLGVALAMALVDPAVTAEGTDLVVDVRGRHEALRVAALPFYKRSR